MHLLRTVAFLAVLVLIALTTRADAMQTDGHYWQSITPAEQVGVVSVAIDALRDGRNNYVYNAMQQIAVAIRKKTGTKPQIDWKAMWKELVASQPRFSRSEDYYAGEITAFYTANPGRSGVYIAHVLMCLEDSAQTAPCEASLR
jgi:hypothetical protein